ncbi:MAG TPA: ABC transporter ATP-binding protein [Thermodesulfobacteriota bacterium]|nr:ABC transporter ATP-binding protein [Thermodesulfobacteriota bacterium]
MREAPVLAAEDLHTYYGDSYIVQGVSLAVGRGEVVALLGRNGVGKTTLIRSIAGFVPPRRGRVRLLGTDVTGWPPHAIARLGLRLVPQGRRVFPSLTVREHLAVAERRGPGARWSAEAVLGLFPRLRERLRQRAQTLSGGEQQMLACARALVGSPELLVMDEPSEGLAPLLVRELRRLLAQLKAEGTSILLVEQNLPFALALADRVWLMSKGRIVYEGTPQALARDEAAKARYLGL